MSNLPPGVTESMIPGNESRPVWSFVPEDFVEVTVEDWTDWNVGEAEAECDLCEAMIGFYLHCSDPSLPETGAWATCFVVDDKVVCEDCREWLLSESERAEAELEAALSASE